MRSYELLWSGTAVCKNVLACSCKLHLICIYNLPKLYMTNIHTLCTPSPFFVVI